MKSKRLSLYVTIPLDDPTNVNVRWAHIEFKWTFQCGRCERTWVFWDPVKPAKSPKRCPHCSNPETVLIEEDEEKWACTKCGDVWFVGETCIIEEGRRICVPCWNDEWRCAECGVPGGSGGDKYMMGSGSTRRRVCRSCWKTLRE